MATIKVYNLQDKAAFLNHLEKFGYAVSSFEIRDVKDEDNDKSYFVIDNVDDDLAKEIKTLFKGNKNIEVTVSKSSQLTEMIRKIIRKEYKRKFGDAKKIS